MMSKKPRIIHLKKEEMDILHIALGNRHNQSPDVVESRKYEIGVSKCDSISMVNCGEEIIRFVVKK